MMVRSDDDTDRYLMESEGEMVAQRRTSDPGLVYFRPGEVTVLIRWFPKGPADRVEAGALRDGLMKVFMDADIPLHPYPFNRPFGREPRKPHYFTTATAAGKPEPLEGSIFLTVNLASWTPDPDAHPQRRTLPRAILDVRDACSTINALPGANRTVAGIGPLMSASPNWITAPFQWV
jgi:hypothetical protein